MPEDQIRVQVTATSQEAEEVRSYELRDPKGGHLPAFTAGAHISVFIATETVRQYSLCNDPCERERYVIAVQRQRNGRGGSVELYDRTRTGDLLDISVPRNNFPLESTAKRHIFLAGGIGITPILSMIRSTNRDRKDWRLYYCIRSTKRAGFLSVVTGDEFCDRVSIHVDEGNPSKGLDVFALCSAEKGSGTYLYCCGPGGLMDAVRAASDGWPPDTVRFENFSNNLSVSRAADTSFEVEIFGTGKVFHVAPNETILGVLRKNGIYVRSLCSQGVCGTCVAQLVSGVADHRDAVLSEEHRRDQIALCCSRAPGGRLVIRL